MNEPEMVELLDDLIRACGAGMNWMEQVDRAKIGSSTRGILHVDIGMCSTAIHKARKMVAELRGQPHDPH